MEDNAKDHEIKFLSDSQSAATMKEGTEQNGLYK